jgi:hypothetical protein
MQINMANKYVLVPEEIFNGLTSTSSSSCQPNCITQADPNITFSKNVLDQVQQLPINTEQKNILYNQELQRYRHLRKEHEDKPVPVVLTNREAIDEATDGSTDPIASSEDIDHIPPLNRHHHKNKKSNSRARRSRAPSPEEKQQSEKSKKFKLGLDFKFKPQLWN